MTPRRITRRTALRPGLRVQASVQASWGPSDSLEPVQMRLPPELPRVLRLQWPQLWPLVCSGLGVTGFRGPVHLGSPRSFFPVFSLPFSHLCCDGVQVPSKVGVTTAKGNREDMVRPVLHVVSPSLLLGTSYGPLNSVMSDS